MTWVTALGAALLLFVSILLHELSHALVAKYFGIPVSRITLFLFGGMANIEHDPDSPKKEVLMAIVGPITSVVLGVLCLGLASLSIGSAAEATDPGQQAGNVRRPDQGDGPTDLSTGGDA